MARWFRLAYPLADSFDCRCLTSLSILRFHIPLFKPASGRQAGRAVLPHPAFGQGLTLSPTASGASAQAGSCTSPNVSGSYACPGNATNPNCLSCAYDTTTGEAAHAHAYQRQFASSPSFRQATPSLWRPTPPMTSEPSLEVIDFSQKSHSPGSRHFSR